MKRSWTKKTTLLVAFAALIGCQSEAPPAEDEVEAAGGSAGAIPYRGEDTGVACETDNDCSDGAFCNGLETCFEGTCHLSAPPNCDDGIECTTDTCSHSANNCVFAAPDEDGDGHADATCLGPDEVPLGDDCDDEDSNNYPGNSEVCALDDPTHDEDCNSDTFGYLDADLDGVVSAACCNEPSDGPAECGTDCDDDNFRRYPDHVEICDGIDNNCDDEVDVNTSEVPWYPDDDGDNFGQVDSEDAVLSCAPVEGYSLRPSDCDDGSPAIHIAAIEECDGFDNDCDGEVDEDGVCACSPNGNARPCACSNERTGIQVCAEGLWATCNCDECTEGETDCIAGILPRVCTNGQWEFLKACTGQFSECNAGVCTCPGGGMDCPLGGSGAGGASGAGGGPAGGGGALGAGGTLGVGGGVIVGGAAGVGGAPGTGAVGGQGGSPGTIPGLDPIVTSTVPPMGAAFDIDGIVSFTFDQDMDPGGLEFVALLDALGNVVPGAALVTDNVLTFTPEAPLASGMEYTLALPASAMDLDGEPLANPYTLTFFTAPLTSPLPLNSDAGLNYNRGRLAVSPAGMVTTILREEDTSLASERALAMDFNGIGWDAPEEVSPIWPAFGFEVAVDDQGWVMATAYDGSTLAQYDRQTSIWSGPVTYTSTSGSTTRNLVTLSGAGHGFYIFQDATTELQIHARDVSGTYGASQRTMLLNDEKRAVAINESGEGVIGTVVTGALRVIHAGIDLSDWTIDSLDSAVWSVDVAVGPDSKKYVAFSQNGQGDPLDQVFVRVHDGSWGSAMDVVTAVGNGDERDPLIGVDDSGNVTVAFRKNGELWTGRMTAGSGVFTGVFKIGLAQPSTLVKYLMEVSPSGDVVLAFSQTTAGSTNLWAARYQTGIGWGLPHLLEASPEPVMAFDLGMDDNGNAYVLYEVAEIDGDESYLVVVP